MGVYSKTIHKSQLFRVLLLTHEDTWPTFQLSGLTKHGGQENGTFYHAKKARAVGMGSLLRRHGPLQQNPANGKVENQLRTAKWGGGFLL